MEVRYGLRPVCRKCGKDSTFHKLADRRAFSCSHCGDHLYPCAGTIFQDSRTSLQTWFYAIYLSASHNGRGSRLRGFVTASAGARDGSSAAARHFLRPQPLMAQLFPLFLTDSSPRDGSRRREKNPRPLHVHRHRDELKMAIVAIQAEIANLLHPVPDPMGRWIATGAPAE